MKTTTHYLVGMILLGSLARIHPRLHAQRLLAADSAGLGPSAQGQNSGGRESVGQARLDCGYRAPSYWLGELRRGVAAGELSDPKWRPIPPLPPSPLPVAGAVSGDVALTSEDIFPFEDTAGVLLTNYTDAQLLDLLVTAANQVLVTYGDSFDFVGFWLNFVPDHVIGTAFYVPIENDVSGIGDPSTIGTPLFNYRADLGLGGNRIEGFVMMNNINSGTWQAGTGANADFTRLALGQEFGHRWATYLPDLLDGRSLQGDNLTCGRVFHWNWQLDGQGSSMEISEWVGTSPANLTGSFVNFNNDIPGGIYSYSDLYLMGYVSPLEMDAGNSELRFMDNSACGSSYSGTISTLSSMDLIASAGARSPDWVSYQKDFRTAWVMIHQPGNRPSTVELNKAVAILEQQEIDWVTSTLGRGTLDNSLSEPCGTAASATFRSAASNPSSYTATAPVQGGILVATVDLTTTGHLLGVVIGYEPSLSLTLGNGSVLLVDISHPGGELLGYSLTLGPTVVFQTPVPSDPSVCGFTLSTQALHFLGGPTTFALSNAQDLVVGF